MKYNRFLSFIVLVPVFAGISYAETYNFPEDGFSISLSEKWIQVPKYAVEQALDASAKVAPNMQRPDYNCVFQLRKNKIWMTYPFIIIYIEDGERISESDLNNVEKISMSEMMDGVAESMKPLVRDVEYGKMYYEMEKRIVWMKEKMELTGVGDIQALSGMVLTEKGYIQITCCAKVEEYESYANEFERIVESVKVAEELVYHDRFTDNIQIVNKYDYPEEGFSISLSEEWKEIPEYIIDQTMDEVIRQAPGVERQNYSHAYQLGKNVKWFTYPYIFVTKQNKGRMLKSELNKMEEISFSEIMGDFEEQIKPIVTDIEYGKMYYDSKRGTIWMSEKSTVKGVGDIRALLGMVLTNLGYIQVSCYALIEEYESFEREFREIVESVRVSEELKYSSRIIDGIPIINRIDWGEVFNAGLKGGIIGAVIGALIAIKKIIFKKNKTDKQE